MSSAIHIIGAGLAGLSAATYLAARGRKVTVYEAARMAGGRCRSYFDPQLGLDIDNGNHLLLACNHAANAYLNRIGAIDPLDGPDHCVFDFYDLATSERWRLAPNDSAAPFWIFSQKRRVPGTKPSDYLGGLALLTAGPDKTVAQALKTRGPLWERMWRPVLVSALNTQLDEASARLAAAIVRESLGAGGRAARPRAPKHGLGPAFIDPALAYLTAKGADIQFGSRLRAIRFAEGQAMALDFGEQTIPLAPEDRVIFAAPAWAALELLPGVKAPTDHRAILNAHYAITPPAGAPLLTGVVGGLTEWLFAFHNRLSVTISAADALIDQPRDDLAAAIWWEICAILALPPDSPTPPARIVKEKRATFAATPTEDAKRPEARTKWKNLFLCGDWTQTGLPATIEGAIRSGETAAKLV